MPIRKMRLSAAAVLCLLVGMSVVRVSSQSTGHDWYASSRGTGDGTLASPMSLTKALSSTSPAQPGDTIWLRAGTYSGAYTSVLNGTASAPIVVRSYPGERVTLDADNAAARSAGTLLTVRGGNVIFRDFELTSSDANRTDQNSGYGNFPGGIEVQQSQNVSLINLVIHDLVGKGVGAWSENTSALIYGCLIYYNGMSDHDHGVYVQNQTGTKRIANNIIFDQASHGIHAYGSSDAYLDNITIEENTAFDNGYLLQQNARNILLGGDRVAQNPVVKSNSTYFSSGMGNSNIGYTAGTANAVVQDNYWIAGNVAVRFNLDARAQVSGNLFAGSLDPINLASLFPSNVFSALKPTQGQTVFVRPNQYEAGRANITVYNWSKASSIAVNVSGAGLAAGDSFEIRDAMNFYGAPVVTGLYTGATVNIPMAGLTPALPVGQSLAAPPHTAPTFGAFVLLKTGSQPAGSQGGSSDTTAPSVSITSPTSGQTVTGVVTLAATATDNTGVGTVQFQVDGVNAGVQETTAPYTLKWDTTGVANGSHAVAAVARDAAGNQTISPAATVTVANAAGGTGSGTDGGNGGGAPAQVVVEAESGQLTGPFKQHGSPATSGGHYIATRVGDAGSAEITFTVPVAGTYVVWARVLGTDDAHDSVVVAIDGGTQDTFDVAEGKWSPDWQWSVVNGRGSGGPASISPRTFQLSAGTHTLTFEGREPDTAIDEILVTNNLTFSPASADPIKP